MKNFLQALLSIFITFTLLALITLFPQQSYSETTVYSTDSTIVDLLVSDEDSVVIESDVELTVTGSITNHGTLENFGTINNQGNFFNNGSFFNYGVFDSIRIDNRDLIENFDTLISTEPISNSGIVLNYGIINLPQGLTNSDCQSFFINYGDAGGFGLQDECDGPSLTIFSEDTTISDLVVSSANAIKIEPGVTLTITGTLTLDGSWGFYSPYHDLENLGTINNLGIFNILDPFDYGPYAAAVRNNGHIINNGEINNNGTINTKQGSIENHGNINSLGSLGFWLTESAFDNYGIFKGVLSNSGGSTSTNHQGGIIDNTGFLFNSNNFVANELVAYTYLNNQGTINNYEEIYNEGVINNDGLIYNFCDAVYSEVDSNDYVEFNGNPIVNISESPPCPPPPLGPQPPSAPLNLVATQVDIDTISLEWEPPTDQGDSYLHYYNIKKDYFTGSELVTDTITQLATFNGIYDNDVSEGVQYTYRVAAETQIGQGPFSNSVTITTVQCSPGVPSAPVNLEVDRITPTTIYVTWYSPWCDGGSPRTSFIVIRDEFRPSETIHTEIERPHDLTSYQDSSTSSEFEYSYRVKAANANGVGPASQTASTFTTTEITSDVQPAEELAPVTTPEPGPYVYEGEPVEGLAPITTPETEQGTQAMQLQAPSAPLNLVTEQVTPWLIFLNWDDPVSDGGSALTGYIIIRNVHSNSGITTSEINHPHLFTSYSDTTVSSDLEYSYRVKAVNGIGIGPPSNLSSPTGATVPESPVEPVEIFGTELQPSEVAIAYNIAAMGTVEIPEIPVSQIKLITPKVLDILPVEKVQAFTPKQFAALPDETIKNLNPELMSKFSKNIIIDFPESKEKILPEKIIKTFSQKALQEKSKMKTSMKQQGALGEQITIDFDIRTFIPPLQQIKIGIQPEEIACNDDLILIKRISNGAPACVKPSTFEKLITMGLAQTWD